MSANAMNWLFRFLCDIAMQNGFWESNDALFRRNKISTQKDSKSSIEAAKRKISCIEWMIPWSVQIWKLIYDLSRQFHDYVLNNLLTSKLC